MQGKGSCLIWPLGVGVAYVMSTSWGGGGEHRYRTEDAEILKSRRKRLYEKNKERIARSQRAYVQKNKESISNYWGTVKRILERLLCQ